MRLAWTLFSALVAVSAVALCMLSPLDPLRWAAEAAFGTGGRSLPAAVPVTRLAEAILAGLAIAQLLILLPLSADAWVDGGRRLAAARKALDGDATDQPQDPSSIGAVAAWAADATRRSRSRAWPPPASARWSTTWSPTSRAPACSAASRRWR